MQSVLGGAHNAKTVIPFILRSTYALELAVAKEKCVRGIAQFLQTSKILFREKSIGKAMF